MAEVRKVVTIVFSDVVGSTRLGERLDPELLRAVMSRYFDAMQGTLERHGGTVEKFIGDAIMAVFGLPTLHEDDALRAVRAAVDMRAALVELNAELEQDHGVRIEMRTGVNTGEVVTGDAVTAQKLATGDAVNVAARLEQAAGAGEILIGEATHRLVAGSVRAEPLEALELAGKTDVVQAWRVHEVLPDTARPTATPLVGREGELALLTTAFELARSERACKLTTVVGPPGIGKSRLTRELTETVAARVAVGRCLAYGEAITYAPLVEIVEQLGDVEQRLAHEDDGAAIWDRISVALGSSSQRVSPEEIAWAFRKLFEAVGRDQPLVVVVDDIHWGEPTLLDLLEYVVGFASGAPILLVCLARPDLFDSRPSWAAPRPNASVVSLDPLTDDETRNLIARLEHHVGTDQRDRIVAAAEGNPLFVEQILALQAEAPNEELSVPPTIQALLSARIDRLPPEERDVLARASIEGRLFHRGAVAELLPDDDRAQLGAALLSLVRKELLRPDRAFFSGDDGFRFSHVLIRDAAYNSTSKQLRAELHERYARWLEQRLGEAEIIGFHLEQAWGYRKELGAAPNALAQEAGQQLWNAAQATSLRMDTRAAAALYRRAAALLPDEPSGELLQEYGAALNRNGDPDGARPVVEQAIERTGRAENRRSELLARLDRLWIPLEGEQRRPNDEIRRRAEALIPELEARSDDLGLTKVWQVIAMSDWNSGRYESAEAALVHALRHARRLGDRLEESEVRVMLLSTWYDGDVPVDEVLRRCEEEIQRSPGDWMIEACALSYSSGMTAMRGEFDRARELIERSIALCGEFNIINVYPTFERRDVELLAGNFTGAEAWLRKAQQESFGIAEWWGVNLALGASLAVALCGQDRYDEVAHMTANVPSDTDGLIWGHVLSRRARARALARVGQPEEAAKLADEAVSLAERTDGLNQRADALLDRAEVADVLGRDDDAARDVAAALALYERKGNLVMAERARRFRAPPTPASRA